MKTNSTFRLLLLLVICINICQLLSAQIRFDVEGDAKIRGKIDIASKDTTTIFIGRRTGYTDDGMERGNTFIGVGIGRFNTIGFGNVATGKDALRANTEGFNNSAYGANALYSNIDGDFNVAVGTSVLYNNTIGNRNVGIGSLALFSNTTGEFNIGIGMQALRLNTTGFENIATGYEALYSNTTGLYNVAYGVKALRAASTGNQNTAFGTYALISNLSHANTATGFDALYANTTGFGNTANGYSAASFNNASDLCTYIGYDADQSSSTDFSNSTALGHFSRITASNQVRIGNGSVTSIGGQVAWSNLSDGRFKRNLKEDVPGLEFILKLRPVTYNFDAHGLADFLHEDRNEGSQKENEFSSRLDAIMQKSRDEKSRIRYTGFIAQEVEKAAVEVGYDFSGVDKPQNEESLYGLRYGEFVVPVVKAIQEQQKEIEDLQMTNDELRYMNAALQIKNKELESRLAKIEALLQQQSGVSATQAIGNHPSKIVSPDARLEQNQPNPFDGTTTIRYYIPDDVEKAELRVMNMEGKIIKTLPIQAKGEGQIGLEDHLMYAGSYFYSLVLDGLLFTTRQMILAK